MTLAGPTLRALSLGAGVQSTTLALMAAHGEFGVMPDCAIFADTQWEPAAVYRHLAWLERGNPGSGSGAGLPFPVHRVTAGSLRDAIVSKATGTKGRFAAVPFFTGDGGMGRRQCTREFKLEPITRKMRELLGVPKGRRVPAGVTVEVWIAISTDEVFRMKPARHAWQSNRWPLIEKRLSRWDCQRWLERQGYSVPPKSSCIGCPYHSDALWREMRDTAPGEWADAVEVDRLIRVGGTLRGMRQQQFMHASRVPLDEVDLSTPAERGQPDLFQNECEGMCGL
jgi:hypothetical protein